MPPTSMSVHITDLLSKEIGKLTDHLKELDPKGNRARKSLFMRDVAIRIKGGALNVPLTEQQFAEVLISIESFCEEQMDRYRHGHLIAIDRLINLVNGYRCR